MLKSSVRVARVGGLALALLAATAMIELLAVAVASAGFEEVAEASPFGRPGTAVTTIGIAVAATAGAVIAWRGAVRAARTITAVVVFITVGITALMAMSFTIAGGTPVILAALLAHATFSIAMIGRAVLRSESAERER